MFPSYWQLSSLLLFLLLDLWASQSSAFNLAPYGNVSDGVTNDDKNDTCHVFKTKPNQLWWTLMLPENSTIREVRITVKLSSNAIFYSEVDVNGHECGNLSLTNNASAENLVAGSIDCGGQWGINVTLTEKRNELGPFLLVNDLCEVQVYNTTYTANTQETTSRRKYQKRIKLYILAGLGLVVLNCFIATILGLKILVNKCKESKEDTVDQQEQENQATQTSSSLDDREPPPPATPPIHTINMGNMYFEDIKEESVQGIHTIYEEYDDEYDQTLLRNKFMTASRYLSNPVHSSSTDSSYDIEDLL